MKRGQRGARSEPLSSGMMARVPSRPGSSTSRVARLAAVALLLGCDSATDGSAQTPNGELTSEVVATGLDTVWELVWGPDGFIWMTERDRKSTRLNSSH